MPVALTRGDRRLLLSAAAAFVLIIAVTLLVAGDPADTSESPTSYSVASSGAKALYRLLPNLGYRVARWEEAPDALTDAPRTTWRLAEPVSAPTPSERRAVDAFLAAGGRLITTGPTGALFVSAGADADPIEGLTWTQARAVTPSAMARVAPTITLAPRATFSGAGRDTALPLYNAAGDRPVVVEVPVAGGRAFWWASATPLTNAGLREPGNLEFVLASIGPADGRLVLFDEYFHGMRRSLAGTIARTEAKWVAVQAGLLILCVLAAYARRSGPIIDPPIDRRLAPLEFVRTLGSLYKRAGAASVAVDAAAKRTRYSLTRRLGLASDATPDAIGRAVEDRWRTPAADVASTLRAADAARADRATTPKQALATVQSLGDLAAALHLPVAPRRTEPAKPAEENR
jgi:hypothetical protein